MWVKADIRLPSRKPVQMHPPLIIILILIIIATKIYKNPVSTNLTTLRPSRHCLPAAQSFHMSKTFPGPFLHCGFSAVKVEPLVSNLGQHYSYKMVARMDLTHLEREPFPSSFWYCRSMIL